MTKESSLRYNREIEHGRYLAERDTEKVWGWGTPAGRLRAERRAKVIIAGAAVDSESRILEIGCGTGLFTEKFASTGANIVAVEISPDFLEIARSRGLPSDKVIFREGCFEECEIEGPFDAVIGSSVLHHLEVEPALRKIFKILKPGGIMSFAEPNYLNPQVFIERAFFFLPIFSHVSSDETAFIRWKLQNLLLKVGFKYPTITPFDWLHPATPEALIRRVRKIGKWLERTPCVREFSGSLHIRAVRPA